MIDPHEPQTVYLLWLVMSEYEYEPKLEGVFWTAEDAKRVAEIGWPRESPVTWHDLSGDGSYLLLDYRPEARDYAYYIERDRIEPTQVKAVPGHAGTAARSVA